MGGPCASDSSGAGGYRRRQQERERQGHDGRGARDHHREPADGLQAIEREICQPLDVHDRSSDVLVCVTELNTRAQIDALIDAVKYTVS